MRSKRSPYQDQMVLTTHKYKIKKEESGNSNKRSAKKMRVQRPTASPTSF